MMTGSGPAGRTASRGRITAVRSSLIPALIRATPGANVGCGSERSVTTSPAAPFPTMRTVRPSSSSVSEEIAIRSPRTVAVCRPGSFVSFSIVWSPGSRAYTCRSVGPSVAQKMIRLPTRPATLSSCRPGGVAGLPSMTRRWVSSETAETSRPPSAQRGVPAMSSSQAGSVSACTSRVAPVPGSTACTSARP
jgi:hypothetical protein